MRGSDFESEVAHRARLMQAGQMLAGVVHEINNPLAVIQGYAQLLQDRAARDEDRHDLQAILDETRRLASLVDDMLSFTRRGPEAVETVDVQRVVQAALNLTAHDMRQARVVVVATVPRDPVLVRASHGACVQVLLNLLGNARQSLESGRRDGRAIALRIEPARAPAGTCLVVSNNGPPIPPELADTIFEPFFTTKDEGEGNGLGLAVCRQLLGRFGATLVLDPPDEAMPVSFRITLPDA
jgi:two-component system C4-dicarboxylate transport sensor histidine kinase DctB